MLIKQCSVVLRLLLTAVLLAAVGARFAIAAEHPGASGLLGPPTPDACFWTERAFGDVPERSPSDAAGIILWSHGQAGRRKAWHWGAPPVIRMFANKGWEVVLAQRNERCAGNWNAKGESYVKNLVEEVDKARKAGYRRVLVAGQSIGAGTALGASARSKDIDGVIAFALSHGRGSCRDPNRFQPEMIPFHEAMIRNGIEQSIAPRILISLGKDDHCIGVTFTPLVAAGLARKNAAYIHFDESMRQTGHLAAMSPQFATTYGACVVDFFSREEAPAKGRHVCDPVD